MVGGWLLFFFFSEFSYFDKDLLIQSLISSSYTYPFVFTGRQFSIFSVTDRRLFFNVSSSFYTVY